MCDDNVFALYTSAKNETRWAYVGNTTTDPEQVSAPDNLEEFLAFSKSQTPTAQPLVLAFENFRGFMTESGEEQEKMPRT